VAFEARKSEYIDQKSGVSARLTISAYENLVSAAERRMLVSAQQTSLARISDFAGVIPAITGKIELVYEGELEGPVHVAHRLIGGAIKTLFTTYFPHPEKAKKGKTENPYAPIIDWFTSGNRLELTDNLSDSQYEEAMRQVPGLYALVKKLHPKLAEGQKVLLMEFVLHGLAEYSQLNKNYLDGGVAFADMLGSLFDGDFGEWEAGDE